MPSKWLKRPQSFISGLFGVDPVVRRRLRFGRRAAGRPNFPTRGRGSPGAARRA